MEAQLVKEMPDGPGWHFEPKWDGFRGVLENLDGELRLWSRNGRPLLRYFPELAALGEKLPPNSALDGEIVIERDGVLQFDSLQMRLHPAESRINRLAGEIPARFVAFDVLLWEGEDVHVLPFSERRVRVEQLPFDTSPASADVAVAQRWLERLELAGFDGVIAKRLDMPYRPGERDAVAKVKHHRTADCVVVGVRWKAPAEGEVPDVVATLLLGLYDEEGELRHVGSTSASAKKRQAEVAEHVLPLIVGDPSTDPIGPPNRWQQKEGLPWSAVEPEAVVEVRYDKWEGSRFRHGTRLMRFRPDKDPDQCTFEQVTQRPGPDDPTVYSLLAS
jgi:ATP-dependent DNA ligase